MASGCGRGCGWRWKWRIEHGRVDLTLAECQSRERKGVVVEVHSTAGGVESKGGRG
jgi:hypothetical protein